MGWGEVFQSSVVLVSPKNSQQPNEAVQQNYYVEPDICFSRPYGRWNLRYRSMPPSLPEVIDGTGAFLSGTFDASVGALAGWKNN